MSAAAGGDPLASSPESSPEPFPESASSAAGTTDSSPSTAPPGPAGSRDASADSREVSGGDPRSAERSTALASVPAYRERLTPGIGTWIVLIVFGALFGVVIVPLSYVASAIVGVVGIAAMIAVGVGSSPLLQVEGTRFSAGRASIDVSYLGEPETVEGQDWDTIMSTGFDPLAHHCTRGWVHGGIRTEVRDDEDPTTAWVISSRRPADLALALRAAQERARIAG